MSLGWTDWLVGTLMDRLYLGTAWNNHRIPPKQVESGHHLCDSSQQGVDRMLKIVFIEHRDVGAESRGNWLA